MFLLGNKVSVCIQTILTKPPSAFGSRAWCTQGWAHASYTLLLLRHFKHRAGPADGEHQRGQRLVPSTADSHTAVQSLKNDNRTSSTSDKHRGRETCWWGWGTKARQPLLAAVKAGGKKREKKGRRKEIAAIRAELPRLSCICILTVREKTQHGDVLLPQPYQPHLSAIS